MMDSIRLYSNLMEPLGELSKHAGTLESCVMSLEINGEHSLAIDTTVQLDVGTRGLTMDPSGRWREWVVDEVEQEHSSTDYGTCSYHLVWSLQYDLQMTNAGTIRQPGMGSEGGCSAGVALEYALEGSMWSVGDVEPRTKNAVIMNFNSAWDRLNQVVKHWGGEIDDTITVGERGVMSRRLNLLEHVGDREAWRRLEWRHDLISISRSPDPGPYYCRVIPLGNGESITADDGATNISAPLTIESRIGRIQLIDQDAEDVFKVRKSPYDDEWFYPTVSVNYSTDNVNELLTLAYADLKNHTRPKVSYTGSVSQLAEAGMEIGDGVSLGDEVQVVDYGFNRDKALSAQERVVKIEWDLINQDDKKVTIGKFRQTLEKTMAGIAEAVGIEEVEALAEMDLPIAEVPEYEAMTIDTPYGEYTISPMDLEPVDIGQYTTDLDSRLADLENVVSGITGIEYDPETDSFYDREGNILTDGMVAGDPDSFVGNELPSSTGGAAISDGASNWPSTAVLGGDGWIHQIDGVTYTSGTINFVTSSSGEGSGGESGGGSSGGSSNKNTKTDRKREQQEHASMKQIARQTAKNNEKESTETTASKKKETKKSNFAVTAANIAGSMGIYIGDGDDKPTYNELFGKSNDDTGFTSIDDWLRDLFGGGGGHSF